MTPSRETTRTGAGWLWRFVVSFLATYYVMRELLRRPPARRVPPMPPPASPPLVYVPIAAAARAAYNKAGEPYGPWEEAPAITRLLWADCARAAVETYIRATAAAITDRSDG